MSSSARQLLITLGPGVAILGFVVAAAIMLGVPVSAFTQDPATLMRFHPLTGLLSHLGCLLWCATAVACLLTATVLRRTDRHAERRFLFSAGGLSLYLLLDDFFLIHEVMARLYLGLREKVVIATLGLAVITHLIVFRSVILRSHPLLLAVALVLLCVSAGIDVFIARWTEPRLGAWAKFMEDGPKWLGIVSWFGYHVRTSYTWLVADLRPPGTLARS